MLNGTTPTPGNVPCGSNQRPTYSTMKLLKQFTKAKEAVVKNGTKTDQTEETV